MSGVVSRLSSVHLLHGLGSDDLGHGLGNLDGGRFPADDGVESVMVIGGVVDDTLVAIGIEQAVLSLDLVTVAAFVLALDISGVGIVDGVGEFVVSRGVLFDLLDVGWLGQGLHDGWLGDGLNVGGLGGDGLHHGRLVRVLHQGLLVVDRGGRVECLLVHGLGWQESGAGHGQNGKQRDELENNKS